MACSEIRRRVTEDVQQPVEQTVESLEQVCEEVRTWVEEQVEQTIETWEQRAEQFCASWPWPVSWVCDVVTTLVLVVVHVVVTVGKWAIYTACRVVTIVVKVVVSVIVRVFRFVTVFLCGLVSLEPLASLEALLDLYSGLLDLIEETGSSLIQTGRTVGRGALHEIGDQVADFLDAFFGLGVGFVLGKALAGILRGVVALLEQVVEGVADVLQGQLEVLAGIFGLNLGKILQGLTNFAVGLVKLVVQLGRTITGGWVAGGIREVVGHHTVTSCVRELLLRIESPDRRDSISRTIGLGTRNFGTAWSVRVRRVFLDSQATLSPDSRRVAAPVTLASLHPASIDLYEAAGVIPQVSINFGRPRNHTVIMGTGQHPTRVDIDRFLAGSSNAPRFRVYAMSRNTLQEYVEMAKRKGRELGLRFSFRIEDRQADRTLDMFVSPNVINPQNAATVSAFEAEIRGTGPATPNPLTVEHFLAYTLGRTLDGAREEVCTVGVGATVQLNPASASARNSFFGMALDWPEFPLSGLVFRDSWPLTIFRYVLIHEIGHYFGLEHAGHTGPNDVMWTWADATLPKVSWATLWELYASGAPRFTMDDTCAVWNWILQHAVDCVAVD